MQPDKVLAQLTDPKGDFHIDVTSKAIEVLVQKKALRGMKILNLGCGTDPVLARTLRAMGALVFTADIKPASAFAITADRLNSVFARAEREHHVVLDLRTPDWPEKILKATGGNFDIVTEAHLRTEGVLLEEASVLRLTRKGGVRFVADSVFIGHRSLTQKR